MEGKCDLCVFRAPLTPAVFEFSVVANEEFEHHVALKLHDGHDPDEVR